jgi:hypothetical protein
MLQSCKNSLNGSAIDEMMVEEWLLEVNSQKKKRMCCRKFILFVKFRGLVEVNCVARVHSIESLFIYFTVLSQLF